MKIRELFENRGLKGLSLNTGFLKMDWEPQPDERQAAWERYGVWRGYAGLPSQVAGVEDFQKLEEGPLRRF